MDQSAPQGERPAIQINISGPSRRQMLIGAAVLALSIILAIGAIIYIRQYTAVTGLPQQTYQSLSFQVYFPKPIAAGFKLDPASISAKSDVYAYSFKYQGSNPVYVSIQPLDPNLDINSFRATREITTPVGKGYLVEFDTRVTVAIVTNKSLIIINSPDHVPSNSIEQLADSFQPAK